MRLSYDRWRTAPDAPRRLGARSCSRTSTTPTPSGSSPTPRRPRPAAPNSRGDAAPRRSRRRRRAATSSPTASSTRGVTAVAAPVLDARGRPLAGLNLTGPTAARPGDARADRPRGGRGRGRPSRAGSRRRDGRARRPAPRPAPPLHADDRARRPHAHARHRRDRAERRRHRRLAPAARARNAASRQALEAVIAAGTPVYGATTGVGALHGRAVAAPGPRATSAAAAQPRRRRRRSRCPPATVRAAMPARATRSPPAVPRVAPALLDALVDALNADRVPAVHELGSLGTGDLPPRRIALALLGEATPAQGRSGSRQRCAGPASRPSPPRATGSRSSSSTRSRRARGVAADAGRCSRAALEVAALSFEAIGADPVVFDERVHRGPRAPGAAAVAARMRALLAGAPAAPRPSAPVPVPVPRAAAGRRRRARRARRARARRGRRAQPRRRERARRRGRPRGAAERQLRRRRPPRDRRAARRAGAVGGPGRVASTLLDPNLSGLPAFLARDPGPDSGAMMLEYTAHEAAAEVRSLALPVAAQRTVARGVESHASFAARRSATPTRRWTPIRRARDRARGRGARATVAGRAPAGVGTRTLFERVVADLPAGLSLLADDGRPPARQEPARALSIHRPSPLCARRRPNGTCTGTDISG